jgi:hypothetical protein
MATNNSINNTSDPIATAGVQIDPGASGDSYVQFDINTTGEFRMGVDDTDDSFRISQGSALGTNDTFIMTAAGERTLPLQPTFRATPSGTLTNVTGDGTEYTVVFATEAFDVGSDFDGTSTYTAPVTGLYCFTTYVSWSGSTAFSSVIAQFDINGANEYLLDLRDPSVATGGTNNHSGGSFYINLTAADTVTVVATASGGAKTVDIITGSTRFMCYLVA